MKSYQRCVMIRSGKLYPSKSKLHSFFNLKKIAISLLLIFSQIKWTCLKKQISKGLLARCLLTFVLSFYFLAKWLENSYFASTSVVGVILNPRSLCWRIETHLISVSIFNLYVFWSKQLQFNFTSQFFSLWLHLNSGTQKLLGLCPTWHLLGRLSLPGPPSLKEGLQADRGARPLETHQPFSFASDFGCTAKNSGSRARSSTHACQREKSV